MMNDQEPELSGEGVAYFCSLLHISSGAILFIQSVLDNFKSGLNRLMLECNGNRLCIIAIIRLNILEKYVYI